MGMLDRSSPFGPLRTVQVSRSNILRRRAAGWTGIQVETVDVIHSAPFEYRAVSPAHMLILTERGSRSDGETMIEGAAKSTLRDFSPRLSLVPVGYRYCGWQNRMCLRASPTFTSTPPGPCSIRSCDFPRSSSRPGCFSRTATYGRPHSSSRAKSGNRHRVTTPKLSVSFFCTNSFG